MSRLNISSGAVYNLASGAIVSGYGSFTCCKCNKNPYPNQIYVLGRYYCYNCANFDEKNFQFRSKQELNEDLLRAGCQHELGYDAELWVIADWYEEKGLTTLASYIRSLDNYPTKD